MDKAVLVWLMTLIACLPLDLAIALQAWLVVLIFRKVSRTKSPHWVASIATILFFLVHAYLWFDFLLYRDTGLRMQFEFFGFLTAADSFTSSLSSFGTGVAVAGVVILLITLGVVYRLFLKGADEFQFSSVGTIMLVVLTALGLYCRSAAPSLMMADYMFGNAAARSQILYAEHWVGRDSLASMDADAEQAANFLTPVAEDF